MNPKSIRIAVAEHRDVDAGAVEQRAHRVERLDLGARAVDRERRAGDVRDDQVHDRRRALVEPGRGVHAGGQRDRGRRSGLGDAHDLLGRQRLLHLLGALGALVDRHAGARPDRRCRWPATRTWRRPWCRRRSSSSSLRSDTGTWAISGRVGQLVPRLEVAAQRAGAHGQHHVVDLDAERVLDRWRTSSSGTLVKAKRRWGVSSVLNDVRGAWNGRPAAVVWRWKPMNFRPCRIALAREARDALRRAARCADARGASRLDGSGIGSSRRGSSGGRRVGRRIGSRSNSTVASSLPDTPSMIEWCTLASIATGRPPARR